MGRPMKKKGESGAATTYVSRKQALKKLQLSLKDFRRLCIIKGVYPVEPKHKKKANKANSTNKTYYYLKDVNFLSHEPLIQRFREFRIFIRRLKRAIGRKDQEASHRLRGNEPVYTLDHIVKERYPTVIDALRDLDDAVSMCFLFSTFPKSRNVKVELIELCRRLTVEFMTYVIESRSLRKVFFSIKGVYYQAEIMGQLVTWIVPHTFGYMHPTDVDFKIMVTFTDFYSTLLGFVNCHLYHSLNLIYPPKLSVETTCDEELLEGEESSVEVVASLNQKLMTTSENSIDDAEVDEFPEFEDGDAMREFKLEEEKIKKQQKLFEGCKIFINREVPRESLVFVIRSFGGEVSYDKTLFLGSTFGESDITITHQIVDRPMTSEQYMNRYYVQPQWVYDCVNAHMLLPVEKYFTGEVLPPHLSPFVQEKEGDYVPPERQALLNMQRGITTGIRRTESDSEEEDDIFGSDSEGYNESEDSGVEDGHLEVKTSVKRKSETQDDDSKKSKMKVTAGAVHKENVVTLAEKQMAEEKRLAIMMIPKKKKHLYDKIVFGQKRKNREVQKLKAKREEYDKAQKLLKKSKIKNL